MPIPTGAYVDTRNRFAITVPAGWKVVEPEKVKVDTSVRTDWRLAATLIAESGRHMPTVAINVLHRVWTMPRDAKGIPEIERWLRATWGTQGTTLDVTTEMTTVDNLTAFHSTMLASLPLGQQMTLDLYLIPVVNQSYAIVAALDGDRRAITAQASLAVARGFYVFKGWE
jgi:hypothetical protein